MFALAQCVGGRGQSGEIWCLSPCWSSFALAHQETSLSVLRMADVQVRSTACCVRANLRSLADRMFRVPSPMDMVRAFVPHILDWRRVPSRLVTRRLAMGLQRGGRERSHVALSVFVVLAYLTAWMKASKVAWECVPHVEASKDELRNRRTQRSRRPTVGSTSVYSFESISSAGSHCEPCRGRGVPCRRFSSRMSLTKVHRC